jgi:hypothetical protein
MITESNWASAITYSQSWIPLSGGYTETYIVTGLSPDTTYWFVIKAYDEVSNYAGVSNSPYDFTSFIINEPPSCDINYIPPNDKISGTITITGNAWDQDGTVQHVELSLDGGYWFVISGTTSWSYRLNTDNLHDGQHTISVRSYDGKDYSLVKSVTVTVGDPPDPKDSNDLSWLWLLLAIMIIISVLLVILYLQRGKGVTTKSSQEQLGDNSQTLDFEEESKELPPPPFRAISEDTLFENEDDDPNNDLEDAELDEDLEDELGEENVEENDLEEQQERLEQPEQPEQLDELEQIIDE